MSNRLEYFRDLIENEKPISWGELLELQIMGEDGLIPESDIALREWAGIPEFEDEEGLDISLRDEYLAKHDDNLIEAASLLAIDLTRGFSETFKAGYTQPNAIFAAIDIFPEVTADQIRSSNRWEGGV